MFLINYRVKASWAEQVEQGDEGKFAWCCHCLTFSGVMLDKMYDTATSCAIFWLYSCVRFDIFSQSLTSYDGMHSCEGSGYPSDALLLPPPSEEFDESSGIKKLIEYKFNEDGKKVKVTNIA